MYIYIYPVLTIADRTSDDNFTDSGSDSNLGTTKKDDGFTSPTDGKREGAKLCNKTN